MVFRMDKEEEHFRLELEQVRLLRRDDEGWIRTRRSFLWIEGRGEAAI